MAVETNSKPYELLRRRILAYYGTFARFAKALGISSQTLSYKLCGLSPWKLGDVTKAAKLLDIESDQIVIFFEL